MAKTFNPNRVGGGTVSIVRAADGTYSLKETGFDQISSLSMIDLGAVATTTTAAKTETAAEKTGTTTADQTKAAFLLPKKDDRDDPFTFKKTLKSAGDVSESLSDSATQTMIANQEAQEQAAGIGPVSTFNADTFDDAVGTRIKDPTESVFGRSTPSKEQFQRQTFLPETKVETPQEKLKMTSSNVQKGLVEPEGFTNPFKGFLGRKFQTEKGSEVTQAGNPGMLGDTGGSMNQMGSTMPGMLDPTGRMGASNTLGISADPSALSTQAQQNVGGTDLEEDPGTIARNDIKAKKTFQESVKTGLKETGVAVVDFIQSGGFTGAIVKGLIGPPETMADKHAKGYFPIRGGTTDSQRIAGNPGEILYAGFNRVSRGGNLEKAGRKRIETREKTLEKRGVNDKAYADANGLRYDPKGVSSNFHRTTKDFKKQESKYVASKQKATQGPAGGANYGGQNDPSGDSKSIVCTAMYQTTGLQDWAKAMKIWYIYQKRYLTIQHQEGYHKLFKPFVKGMHKSNIIKAIGAHFAKHRTQHLKHVLFKSKPSLLGKVYSKVLETICYWAGKK